MHYALADMAEKSHALVVGGSGMLAGVSRGLAERGHYVSVVARGAERLEALRSERITPVQVDYGDSRRVRSCAPDSDRGAGPDGPCRLLDPLVARESLRLVAGALPKGTPLYHVLGTSGSPAAELERVDYRIVRLGRKGDVWLTDEEISSGVLEAIDRESRETLVGEP
jgi:NAD(P)-dependent dehydrogenase (short-subunit alcohol dehydrogenase family)